MLIDYLKQVPDRRRGQGQQYQLYNILLFSIFAILCGANSYRTIESFIIIHFYKFDEMFNMGWVRAPSYSTIRNAIKGINTDELELVFRQYTSALQTIQKSNKRKCIAIDGKTLRGSFDNLIDQKAIHVLSIFDANTDLILGHYKTEEKSNEIPALINFLKEIGLSGYIITLDAMHCQKNY